jgi:hypothetical protein
VRERPDGGRTGYLVGPFDTHEEALGRVEEARRIACEVNDRGIWYAYGTARVERYRKAFPWADSMTGSDCHPALDLGV